MSLWPRTTEIPGFEDRGPLRRVSLGEWEVGDRYEIRDGIVGDWGENLRSYYPVQHPELPGRLARVHDAKTALEFVSEWGMLGRYGMYMHDTPLPEAGRRLTEEAARHKEDLWLSPVYETPEWFYANGNAVRFLLRLIKLRKEGQPRRIRDYLRGLIEKNQKEAYWYVSGYQLIPVSIGEPTEEEVMEVSAGMISGMISANTKYLQPAIAPNIPSPGDLTEHYTFPALLPVIYGHLHEAAIGRLGYYQCAYRNCEEWHPVRIEVRGPKHRYCPPDQPGTESRCSRLERYYRDKDKG